MNPSLYQSQRAWQRELLGHWPGTRYVDAVGSTMIDFGGVQNLPSPGTAQTVGTGVLDWDVQKDPPAAAQLAAIIRDGSH